MRTPSAFKAVIRTFGAQVLVLALNLGTGMLTARLLGPDGRGIYSAVVTWPLLLAQLSVSGLQSAVVVHAARDASATSGAASLLAVTLSVLIAGAGALVLPLLMGHYEPSAVTLGLIYLAVAPVQALHIIMKQGLSGVGAFGPLNLVNVLTPAVGAAALLSAAALGPLTPESAVIAAAVATVATVLLTARPWWSWVRPAFRDLRGSWARMRGFVGRAFAADLVVALAGSVDRIILIPLVSEAALGLYVVAYSFSRVILVLSPVIGSVVFSRMASHEPVARKILHDRAFRFVLAAIAVMMAGLWLFDRWLLTTFYGREFGDATVLFRVLALEAGCVLLLDITMKYLLSSGRPAAASLLQVVGLALSTALILSLTSAFGVLGAAAGAAAAAALKLAAAMALLRSRGETLPGILLRRDDLAYLRSRLRARSGPRERS